MSSHEFRNPDKLQVLPFRDWIRDHLPGGPDGYVVEDLDLVLRIYGPKFKSDATGKFMLIELKFGHSWIGVAQRKTFGLMHNLLRNADPGCQRYLGYFVLQYDNEDWDIANFSINRESVTRQRFMEFLLFDVAGLPEITF